MYLKNGKKLYNERRITFFHETERYVNNLNIYNRSKNGTNLWDDLILQQWSLIYSIYVRDWLKYLLSREKSQNIRSSVIAETN